MMSSSIDLLSSSTITSNEIIQKMNNEHNDIPALLNHLSITQHSIITFLLLTSSDPPTTPPPDNTVAGDSSNLKIEQFRKVKDAFNTLKKFEDHVSHPIKVVLRSIYDALDVAASSQTQLRKLNLIVAKLKLHVSSAYIISSSASSSDVAPHGGPMWWKWNPPSSSRTPRNNCSNVFVELPNLHTSDQFLHSSAFKGIREIYDSLDKEVQCCLLCFAAFPENMIVKKRVLLYWWIGEELLPISSTAEVEEDVADVVLKKLMLTGFIVPVNPKRKLLVADSFKMHPFIRSAVITFAQETGRFFDFDPNNKGSCTTMNFSSCQRASCLVKLEESPGSSLVPPPPINININTPNLLEDHGKVHTLFNVSEPYLGFELDWFTKIKNVKVVYLGRWQCLPKHHIEVDNIEFLKGFKYMKHLKFFSLQGISRINELPNSICRLTNLRILDLRACHNLEVIPDGIGSLKNLTHLDMSECYLLTHMPKGIGLLSQLQVLKGFVISTDSSKSKANITTLNDLGKLKKLRKLSISASFRVFPTNKELTALQQFEALRKLTIAWGGRSFQFHQDKKDTATRKLETIKTLSKTLTFKSKSVTVITTTLPMSLEKLDLRCFPRTKTPSWLMPEKLQSLKKLYIRGGNLRGFLTNDQWKVEILRLKFLGEMKMDWRQVQSLFPNLIYLEKIKWPNLTLFPCDESGVRLNENQAIAGN